MSELPPNGGAMVSRAQCVARLLTYQRLPVGDEKLLQDAIANVLAEGGIPFRREVRLNAHDIVDFMIDGGIALEIKIKGGKTAIYYQCRRYCEHAEVAAIVLATNLAMGLPATINDKPAYVAALGEGWL
jgi:hypothetical protein